MEHLVVPESKEVPKSEGHVKRTWEQLKGVLHGQAWDVLSIKTNSSNGLHNTLKNVRFYESILM